MKPWDTRARFGGEGLDQLARFRIQQARASISNAGKQELPGRNMRQAKHGLSEAAENPLHSSNVVQPHSDRRVRRRAEERLAVGSKDDGLHRSVVIIERAYQLSG